MATHPVLEDRYGKRGVAVASPGGDAGLAPAMGTHVSLYDFALSRTPQQAVLTWFLGSSTSSLRILDLHGVSGIAVRKILGVHAPHLRSLRLLHFSLDSVAFLRQCTRLEELVIYNLPVFVPLAPELPPSIEHLPFRNPRHAFRNTLGPILDAIEVLP